MRAPSYSIPRSPSPAPHLHVVSDLNPEAWTNYSPTWTNLTVGTPTSESYSYTRIGSSVHYRGFLSFGASTSVGGAITVSLPVDAKAGVQFIGTAKAEDTSAAYARTVGLAEITSTVWGQNINFTSNGVNAWNATVPFTWAVNDGIAWAITYEAAS